MAYEISSSIAQGTVSTQNVAGSTTTARASGGHFSPDGTRLAVPKMGSSANERGIDIYTSSSASGWTKTDFCPALEGTDYRYVEIVQWLSNSELVAQLNARGLYTFTSSSSGGWSQAVRRTSATSAKHFAFSPDQQLVAVYQPFQGNSGIDYVDFYASGSGLFSFAVRIDNASGVNERIQAIEWLSNTDIAIGVPEHHSSEKGEVTIWRTTDGGSSFSEIDNVVGSTAGEHLGAALYYHSASGNLIVGTGRPQGSPLADSSTDGQWFLYQSTSAGGYVQGTSDRTLITETGSSSGRVPLPYYMQKDDSNGRFAIGLAASTNTGTDGEVMVWESGSADGWKGSIIDDNVYFRYPNAGSIPQVGLSINGLVANNNNVSPQTGDKTFRVHTLSSTPTDETGPSVSSVTITSATNAQNNTLNEGDVVSVTVSMDEATVVNTTGGTPFITLNIGGVSRNASYASGTGTTSLVFQYTIASSETADTDGISIGANAISLNSGTMQDAAGNNATLTHDAVAANSSFKVDTDKPTISSVVLSADNSTATVTFSEDVYANSAGSGDLDRFDFSLGLSGGNSSLISLNATPSSISKTSQSVYVLTLNGTDLDFIPNGNETLVVDSANDTSIFDAAGNAHTAAHAGQALNDRTRFVKFRITNGESAARFFYADVGGGTGDDSSDYVFIGEAAAGATLTSSVFSLDKFFGDGKNNEIVINSATAAANLGSGGSGGNPITTDAQFISYFNIASGDADQHNGYTLENSRKLVAYGQGSAIQNTAFGSDGIQTGSSNQNKAKYLNITRPSGGRPDNDHNTYGTWTQFDVSNTQLDTTGLALITASLTDNTTLKLVFDGKPVNADGTDLTNSDLANFGTSDFLIEQSEADGTDNDFIKRTTTGSMSYDTTNVTDDTIVIPIDYEGSIKSGDTLDIRLHTRVYRDIHANPAIGNSVRFGVIGQELTRSIAYPATGSTGTITYDDINFHFVNSHESKTAYFYMRVDTAESGTVGNSPELYSYLDLGTVAAGQTGSFAVSDIYFDDAKRGSSSPIHTIYAHTASVTFDMDNSPDSGDFLDSLTLNQYSSSNSPVEPRLVDNRRNFSASFNGSEFTTRLQVFVGSSTTELDYYVNIGTATLDSQVDGTGSITIDWGERVRASTVGYGGPSSVEDLSGGLPNNVFRIEQDTGSLDTISNLRIESGSLQFATSARTGVASGSWTLKFNYDGLADGTERLRLRDRFEYYNGFWDDELNTGGSGQYWSDLDTTFPDSWENSGTKKGFALSQDALTTDKSEAITAADGGTLKAGGTNSAPVGQVSIPANALKANTTVGVNTAQTPDSGILQLRSEGVASSNLIRLTPHGTKFNSPVTVTIRLKDGAPTDNLRLFKRNDETKQWYEVLGVTLSVTDGAVSFTTTSFSDYIVIGGKKVARTKINNIQLARLEERNKVLAAALNLTASINSVKVELTDTERFLVQSTSGESQVISASAMAAYFAQEVKPEQVVLSSTGDDNTYFSVIMTSGSTAEGSGSAQIDAGLRFNASTNELSGSGPLTIVGASSFGPGGEATISAAGAFAGASIDVSGEAEAGSLVIDAGSGEKMKVTSAGAISSSAGLTIVGASSFGPAGEAQIDAAGAFTGASIDVSGEAEAGSLSIDAGSGTVMKVTSAGAISSSVGLTVVGASSFGPGDNATISAAGAIAGASLAVGGAITGASLDVAGTITGDTSLTLDNVTITTAEIGVLDNVTPGTADPSKALVLDGSKNIGTINQLTASAIRVDQLDVVTINSIQKTQETLEIADALILASSGSNSADADGSGLQIGGTSGNDTVASVLYEHTGAKLEMKIAGTAYARVDSGGLEAVGTLSSSAGLEGASVAVDGNIDAGGDLTAGTITMTGIISGSNFLDLPDGKLRLSETVVDATAAELNLLDGAGADAIVASKAVIYGSSGEVNANSVHIQGTEAIDSSRAGDLSSLKVADLTATEIVFASTGGELVSDDQLTFDSTLHLLSASQISGTFHGDGSGLSGVKPTTSNEETNADEYYITFVSGSGFNGLGVNNATDFYMDSSSLKYNPNTNKLSVDGVVSGSGALQGASVAVDGTMTAGGKLTVTGVSDLDGGIDVNNSAFTVATNGAVVATSLNNNNGGITNAGAIAGATTVSGSGKFSAGGGIDAGLNAEFTVSNAGVVAAASLVVDDGSTIGTDNDPNMLTLTNGDKIEVASDVSLVVTKGKLEIDDGNFVDTTAAELNLLDADTAASSVALAKEDAVIIGDASAANATKKVLLSDLATLFGSGNGIQVSNGALSVESVTETYSSASSQGTPGEGTAVLSEDLVTASFNVTANGFPLTGSLEVYVNGMLQIVSGALEVSSSVGTIGAFDYSLSGTAGQGIFGRGNTEDQAIAIVLAEALDEDDILQIKYIRK